MTSDTDRADRVSQTLARSAPFLGLLVLLVHQGVFFSWNWEAVAWWQIAVWLGFVAFMFTLLMTGGALFMPRRIRELANDEVTKANRSIALHAGFFVAMVIAILLVVVSPFEPINAQRAGHMIVSMSLGISLLVFGLREMTVSG